VISFRYHLVSIIAVFLALALGVVVGTTGLNSAILSNLKQEVKNLRSDNGALRTVNAQLQKQAANSDQYASEYMRKVLTGTLSGKRIVVVSAPGTDGKVKAGVVEAILTAGGTVVGRIQLASAYVDKDRGPDITALSTGPAHPAGLTLPATSDPATLGGALLAYVLSGKGTSADLGKVISGFSALNMLKVEGADPKGAELAVVLASGTLPKADPRARVMPALISEFSRTGLKTLAAGDSGTAIDGGLLARVRADSALQRTVSTVDNADTSLGQVSTVLALAALTTGTTGQYGTGPGVDRLFPTAPK
jgi:Copper transport outer membrane protein, MctB